MQYSYKHAVLGGTFDHLHQGHKHLLTTAFHQAEKVTIGLSLPHLSHHKRFAQSIQPYEERHEQLAEYLKSQGLFDRATILPLNDIYGITLDENDLDVLLVTEATAANGALINTERQKRRLSSLTIIHVPFVLGDDGKIISSERIRAGEIDREGRSYLKFFLQKDVYLLPVSLRERLQQPLGTLLHETSDVLRFIAKADMSITVGDIVSINMLKTGYIPAVSIIDFHTRRESLDRQIRDRYFPSITHRMSNQKGTINTDSATLFQSSFQIFYKTKTSQTIAVEGEEDLLTLPAILFAPLNALVLYGQPEVGVVVVQVTEERKTFVRDLLTQFS